MRFRAPLVLSLFCLLSGCGGGGGSESNPAPLPPTITQHPQSLTVTVGQAASFQLAATGTAPLNTQWRKNGATIPGAASSSYALASVSLLDAGSYDAIVSNVAGSATSNPAILTVNGINCPVLPRFDDFSILQTPNFPEPQPREEYQDPVFGTCLLRLTDRSRDLAPGDGSKGLKNEYSRVQSFNADESLILIRGLSATWYLYDALTHQPLGLLPIQGPVDPRWDAQDPNKLYFCEGTRFRSCQVRTGQVDLIHDFSLDFADAVAVWSRYEGSPSADGRYWGFMVQNAQWETIAFLIYDLQEKRLSARRNLPEPMDVDSVSISPKGDFFLAYFDNFCPQGSLGTDSHPCGLMIYDKKLEQGRGLLRIVGHSDLAYDAQGREVLIYQDIDTDQIAMLELQGGQITPLWPIDFSHGSIGLHFSGRAFQVPGWALVSTYDGRLAASTWMDKQLFAVELKAGGRVARLAHTRSRVDEGQEHDYWAEPHGTVNRDFTQILFTSNWGRSGTEEVDTFFLRLPHGWLGSAPQITQQPQGLDLNPGQSARFEVKAIGTPPLNYQWQKESQVIPLANMDNYQISAVSLTDAGNYAVRISNAHGSLLSAWARLNVQAPGFNLVLPATPFILQPGRDLPIQVQVQRIGGHSGAIDLSLLAPPTGLSASGRIPEGALEGVLLLQAAASVQPATYDLLLQGQSGGLLVQIGFKLEITIPNSGIEPIFSLPAPDGRLTGSVDLSTGIPMAKGVMTDPASWHLETLSGIPVPAQLDPAAYWPDGSIRWVHVSHRGDIGSRYKLRPGLAPAVTAPLQILNTEQLIQVDTGNARFSFNRTEFRVLDQSFVLHSGGETWTARPAATGDALIWPPVEQAWDWEVSGPIKAVLKIEGDWRNGSGQILDPLVRWRARLTFWRASSRIRCEFTLRNVRPYDQEFTDPPDHAYHALSIAFLRFGSLDLLPQNQQLGAGLEKTFDLDLDAQQSLQRILDWDPSELFPRVAPRPVGFPDPAYLESTGALWPCVAPLGGSGELQEALDRYEKLMRSMAMTADVEHPQCSRPGPPTIVAHLAQDRGNWLNYGCLQWAGNGCNEIYSRNHYDFVFGLYLNALRSGRVELFDLAQIMARHEIDLDHYHTHAHNPFYNHMRNWEEGDHRSPANCFGLGRPSHTWNRGYLLHWLWCAEARGLDMVMETIQGAQAYLYEGTGHPWKDREVRFHGWMVDVAFSGYLLDPHEPIGTLEGPKTPQIFMADLLEGVLQLEEQDGAKGYIREADWEGHPVDSVHLLQLRYLLEPLINAYEFVFKGSGHPMESRLGALCERMARFLMARTEGGTQASGLYTPRYFWTHWRLDGGHEGDPEYAWTQDTASYAGWLWLRTREPELLDYARKAFRDFSLYRDGPADPQNRVPTRYGSCVYWDTESKLNGWFLRGGQWFLKAEKEAQKTLGPAAK